MSRRRGQGHKIAFRALLGGQFAGGAAQLRLVPAGTRPTSGQTGDLFVDTNGHLHYCKAGGSTASWVQLA